MSYRPPFERTIRTIPLGSRQSPAPAPDALELRAGMRVYCHEGYVGKLEGVALDTSNGLCNELLIHIRGDILSDVETTTSPLASLLDVAGQRLLVSPAWASSVKRRGQAGTVSGRCPDSSSRGQSGADSVRNPAATATRRSRVTSGVFSITIPPFPPTPVACISRCSDGTVRIWGSLPTPRHRASAEQDIWHVPGVFALHNQIIVNE